MAETYREDIATIDLTEPLLRESVGKTFATGDKLANRIGVRVRRRGQPVDLTGHAVTGYFIRPDLQTVVMDGATDGDLAYVDIPQACLTERGTFSLAIKISGDDVTQTLRVLDGSIILTQTDALIDPGDVIPTLDDIFAQIAAMEAAADNANAAAEYANQAASSALNTTLYLMGAAAPVIIQSASGDGVVSVSDSAERSLSGMSVYGKTTQAGTPSPDNPAELVNIGTKGNIGLMVRGKNLLQNTKAGTNTTTNGITFSCTEEGVIAVSGTSLSRAQLHVCTLTLPAGEYIMSQGHPGVAGAAPVLIAALMKDTTQWVDLSGSPEKRFTLETNTEIIVSCDVRTAGETYAGFAVYPMIRIASDMDTTFASYQDGGSMTASTPNGLPGLPVTSGGNYIDANGQQWVCDEIDFVRKVYVKRLGALTLDGSQLCSWNAYPTMPNGGYLLCYLPAGTAADPLHIASAISDSFINRAGQAAGLFGHGSFRLTEDGSALTFSLDGVSNTSAAMQWFGAHPATFLYVLKTPVETSLTAEELTGSTSLTAQYPNTTAFNDAGAGMKMEYIADTKIYIDQRIAALLNA